MTPGRSLKFTAQTSQRHETWFNALSYLLLKSTKDKEDDGEITAEEVDEFNPGFFRSSSRTGRSRMSVSSRVSKTTVRTISPQRQHPTLRAPSAASRSHSVQPSDSLSGRLSSLSGIFKSSSSIRGSITSRYSRQSMVPEGNVYDDPSECHDSAEDLRARYEAEDANSDRLENVRACCDGKHDVGSIPRESKGGKAGSRPHSHSHKQTHA